MNNYFGISKFKRLRRPLVVAAVILVVYAIGNLAGFFTIPELKARDLFLNIKYKLTPRPEYLDEIVIVGIGDKAVKKKWPWKRDAFANLVYKLKKHKPAVIGFDLAFTGKSAVLKASDFLLAEAFRDTENVILASYFDEGRYVRPEEDFSEAVLGYGFTNKPEDKDNVIRDTRLFQSHILKEEIIDYAFDLELVWAFEGSSLKDLTPGILEKALGIPVPKNGIIPINYSGKLSDFTLVSFGDVISGNVSPDLIRDRIVLVGTTGDVFKDTNLVPLGKMPGVAIIANTVAMLHNRTFVYKVPTFINILLLLILSITVSFLTINRGISSGTIWVAVILAGFIGLSLILVMNNVWWDFFSIPIVVLAVYLTGGVTNYLNLLIQSFKIKKFVIVDILTGLPTRRYFILKLDNILKHIKQSEDLSLVLFGMDNFELIVSELGAEKANEVINEVADLVVKYSRKTRGIDFISRYGEVEFCCILQQVSKDGALSYANRIRKTLNTKITSVSTINLSAGIIDVKSLEYKSTKAFVKYAETVLVRARKEGPNKVCVYDPEIDKIPLVEYKEEKEISESDLSYVAEEFEEKYKEMAILVNRLRIAQEEVIKSERLSAVGKVAATIHHDLSKPIVNLQNSLEMIKDDLDKVDLSELSLAKKFITAAVAETMRLEELSESLKDLYRPKGKEVVALDINSVMEEMLNLSSGQMIKKSIKLIRKLDPNLPKVLANSGELKQIFLNLISNAIQAMVKGGELEIESLVAKDKENMVEVRVKDTGCGIPQENLERVFEAFFTSKKQEKGSGLGLYASLEIAKRYGGTIQIDSAVGTGTTFKVYLPFQAT